MTKARDLGDFISDGTIAETVTADGLNLGDNEKIQLGASQDLQIFHDGSHSIVKDSGTGNLKLLAENFSVQDPNQTEQMILATPNGSVNLYYDAVKKFETSSTGATVTGTIAVSDSFNATSGTFTVQSNGTDILNLTSTVMSPQTDGAISLGSSTNGFNNMYLDGSAYVSGNVGIGTSSPSYKLHTSSTGDQRIQIDSTNNNTSGLFMKVLNSGSTVGQGTIRTDNTGNMQFYTGTSSDAERFRFGPSGQLGIGGATYGTSGQVLTSGGSGAAPTWADAAGGGGSFDAQATATITAGQTVGLNSNGTVSPIAVTNSLSNLSSTYTSQTTYYTRLVWIAADQRFIVFYRDGSNNYLMASIGEISSGTINWGTPITVTTRNAYLHGVSCENVNPSSRNAGSMVVTYRDGSNGQACAQVVQLSSPSSLTVGGAVELGAGDQPVAAYNYTYGPHVVVYRNSSDSYKPYYTNVTRSGTSLTQGSGNAKIYDFQATTIDAVTISGASVCAVISDRTSSTKKLVALTLTPTSTNFCNYSSATTMGSGTSGWDIQAGLRVASETLNLGGQSRLMVVAPSYGGTSRVIPFFATNGGTFNIGTAVTLQYSSSEADIGFAQGTDGFAVNSGGYVELYSMPAYPGSPSATLSSNVGNISVGSQYVAVSNNYSGSFNGFGFVGNNEKGRYLSAESNVLDYIGIAGENISSGATGKILTLGSVSEDQTSLTSTSFYYLADDGSLSTTVTSGREVGKAVASTKLILTTVGVT